MSQLRGRDAVFVVLLGSAAPIAAQTTAETAPPPAGTEPAGSRDARVYAPEDFARFAPRNALDMLNQVPGFTIDSGDTSRRGLGQASANVLINGQRFSGKSNDLVTELSGIPVANVQRIEIVDGATLDVPGLTGQVANVVTAAGGLGGTFSWRPQYSPKTGLFRPANGEISVSGSASGYDYTLSLRNDSSIFGSIGPEVVLTPSGAIIDRREERAERQTNSPRLSGSVHRDFGNGSVLNLNAAVGLFILDFTELSLRSGIGQPDRRRLLEEQEQEWNYEVGGDYEFGLGHGRLQVIGLRRFEHSPFGQQVTVAFPGGGATTGDRFERRADEAETILRNEFRWSAGSVDWQVSAEGALNTLAIQNSLYTLDPSGNFLAVPFPDSAAKVEEKRAEAALSYNRPLASNLTLQSSVGVEYSRLSQTGATELSRTFYRPKGYVSVAWQPSPDLDMSARLEREVGQLNFFDFVASTNLSVGTANAGNANLVPPQSWNVEAQATRNLGAWGRGTARLYGRLIEDIVDIIPIGDSGQSPGNLESATVYGIQWTSTFNFDPAGWRGAKLDLDLQFQKTSLEDPLTGLSRPINQNMTRRIEVNFRQDVPDTDWAYGAEFRNYRESPLFRLDEVWRFVPPNNLGVFVEHKDVWGLTVRATMDNVLDVSETFRKDVFGPRRTGALLFTEDRVRSLGPTFSLSVSGTL